MKAAVGEKGAQGIRPYLMIDVVMKASPERWEMVAECMSTSVLVILQLIVAEVHILNISITFNWLSLCISALGGSV